MFARSVLEKHVKGKVFIDDIENPNTFYIVHLSGMSLLYGKLNDIFLTTHLRDYLLGLGGLRESVESLQVVPGELEKKIDCVLDKSMCFQDEFSGNNNRCYKVVKDKRRNFKFNKKKFIIAQEKLNLAQHQFKNVDVTLFERIKGSAVPNQFWDSAISFTNYGIGFSIIHKNILVATAFSSFIHEGMLEIGVETLSQYQKKGFGSIVCAKLISYCLKNNLEPVWSCRYGNIGSVGLAKKIGFEPTVNIPYYELLS